MLMRVSLTCEAMWSHSDRREEDREYAVEDDDQENRLYDRGRGLNAERLGATLHLQAFTARNSANRERHERSLDHADFEMGHRNRFLETRDESRGAHAAIKPRHQSAAVKCRHAADKGENR